jgi:RNA polymerase sigma-70 factor (ECF subfamily)
MNDPVVNCPDFQVIALEHINALYGFAMALTRNGGEAEDLVQETYLRAVRAYASRTRDGDLKGWLFAIMRNIWLNQIRHARSGPRFVELNGDEDARPTWALRPNDPHVTLIAKMEQEEVRVAIESLPVRYREVVVLRDLEGFSYQEIAIILGCPAGTVMSRLGRARERLRLLLVPMHREGRPKSRLRNEGLLAKEA